MSSVRLLVGTRKGAFILTADGARTSWAVEGPLFGGWEVFHLKGSPVDPDSLYAGVEDAALFRSNDGGTTWHELSGLRGHGTGPAWQPGAAGMCLHTILLDPGDPGRIFVAISAAGEWEALTDGLPQSYCYVNVLRDATSVDTMDPCGIYFGTTGGQVYGSADSGDHWAPIVNDLPAVLPVEAQVLP